MSYSINAITNLAKQTPQEFYENVKNIKTKEIDIKQKINEMKKESEKYQQYLFNVKIFDFAKEYPNLKTLRLDTEYASNDKGGGYPIWWCKVEVYDENLEGQNSADLLDLISDSLSDFDSVTILGYNMITINFEEIRAIQLKNMLDANIASPLKREKASKI